MKRAALMCRLRGTSFAAGLALAAVVAALAVVYFAFPETVLGAFIAFERGRAGVERKTIRVDEHAIVYLDGGAGEPVLLVHGYGGDKDNWTRFARHLTPTHRVVALDLPAFGETARAGGASYDIGSQVERLDRFAVALGLDTLHLGGNSMGGQIAAVYAARHPERVKTLALFAPAGITPPRPSAVQIGYARGELLLVAKSIEDYDRVLGLNFVQVPFIPRPIKAYFARRAVELRPSHESVRRDIDALPVPLEPLLGRIRAPTLVLWGDGDEVLDSSGQQVVLDGIAGARKVVMERCGHTPQIERPSETARHYLEFLKR